MKNNDDAALSQTNRLSIDKVIKNLFSLLAFKYENPEVKYIRWDGEFEVVRHSIVKRAHNKS